MTPTTEDIRLLEIYAAEKARQEAERKQVERYSSATNPDGLLESVIFEIVASTAASILNRDYAQRGMDPLAAWQDHMRSTMFSRLGQDYVFGALVKMQAKLIIQEVDAYKTGTRVVRTTQAHPWLELHAAIAKEREECAKLAEGEIFGHVGTQEGFEVARLIRERK